MTAFSRSVQFAVRRKGGGKKIEFLARDLKLSDWHVFTGNWSRRVRVVLLLGASRSQDIL